MAHIAVIGGQNVDIFGRPDAPLVARDSNPGKVRVSEGGVARNIAFNLSLLGEHVKFITAFGGDIYATRLAASCRQAGIDISNSLFIDEGATSIYLFITNENGDMELAVSDMEIYEEITPAFLLRKMAAINEAGLCVVDTNLTEEALRCVAENCVRPIFADAVSTAKAKKLQGILGRLHTLKVNRLEAGLLSGIEASSAAALDKITDYFLLTGMKQLFLSLGEEGLFCANSEERLYFPCRDTRVVNATGAGDSLTAAVVWGWRQGLTLRATALAGLAAAENCLACPETVNPDLSKDKLTLLVAESELQQYHKGAY